MAKREPAPNCQERKGKKMKKIHKILAICMVLVLSIVGINPYAYASITEDTNTGTITVSGLEAGVEVTAYQLTTVNYDYDLDQPKDIPYKWDSSVETWLKTQTGNGYDKYVDPKVFYDEITSNSTEAENFYSALTAAIKGGQITITTTQNKETTGDATFPVTDENLKSSVQFTDCAMGTYLIIIENGYMVYRPVVVNLTPEFTGEEGNKEWNLNRDITATVKASKPQIVKTVTNTSNDKDNYSSKDEITFTIVADVPRYLPGSVANNYGIMDQLANGLNLVEDSITIYGVKGASEEELPGGAYALEVRDEKSSTVEKGSIPADGFSVLFNYENISSYDSVKIVYKAKLNRNSNMDGTGNKNVAYLRYNNNPYEDSSYQTQTDSNTVYTYGIDVAKVDKSTQAPLTGAEFELLDTSDEALYFVKTADGTYYQANEGDQDATTTLIVDGNGKLYIYGLDVGTYSLKETVAPEGYNIASNPVEVIIADDDVNGILDDEDSSTGVYSLSFPNSEGFTLPVTGGIGTVVFVAGGIVFVGLGIALLVVAMKKK